MAANAFDDQAVYEDVVTEDAIAHEGEAASNYETAFQADNGFGFAQFMESAFNKGYMYEVPVADGVVGSRIKREGRELVNFSSINFMGFQEDPKVIDYFCTAAFQYGLVTGGSRTTQGICGAHATLESMMNRITGKEYTLTFGSGLLANIGFLNAMTARFAFGEDCGIDNRDSVIVMDHDSHWSLWKGASHLSYKKNLFAFKHNDPESLDNVLSSISARKKVVVFESVYSSDGSVAPISELLDVCEQHGALSYVDDANGFLVYGRPGHPYYEEYEALRRATFIMVSYSKSVGLEGGAISGPREYVQCMEALSGTSLFTAAMQPPTAATAAFLIDRLDRDPNLMDGYLKKVKQFRERLLSEGFRLYDTESYIASILIGKDQIAEDVRQHLSHAGFAVPVFRYPAVRRNQAVARLILNNRHSAEDIERFIEALNAAREAQPF